MLDKNRRTAVVAKLPRERALQVLVYMPSDLLAEVDARCRARGLARSEYVRAALADYMTREAALKAAK